MVFELTKSSDWKFKEEIEINSFEDLQNLQKRFGYES